MSIAPTTAIGADDWTDLADRTGDGLKVELLWSRATGRVKLTIIHLPSGRRTELDVPPADALTAFYHPFGYHAVPPRAVAGTAPEPTPAA